MYIAEIQPLNRTVRFLVVPQVRKANSRKSLNSSKIHGFFLPHDKQKKSVLGQLKK
jgi:hypothetical protein